MVNAVTEAGDLLLVGEHLFDVLDRIGPCLVDGVEKTHGGLVGAPVEWTFEGADGPGYSGVNVG